MRSKLLKSFIYVFSFWWMLFAIWWSLTDPQVNHEALIRVHRLLPFMPVTLPEGSVNVLHAWGIQKQVLMYWSVPFIVASALMAAGGAGAMWYFTWTEHKARIAREAPRGKFRGASMTMGPLPMPKATPREVLDLGAADSEAFACMSEGEKALLVDIIGIISAHPNAFSGSGIGVSLLEHTVRVVEEALSSKNRPGLSAIVAAAHETGKITAFRKEPDGEWVRIKNPDREAARHLATLDTWWNLPSDTRLAILFAVKYKSAPALLPEIDENPHIHKLAKDLLYRAAESTGKVAAVAKERVLAKQELPAVALKGFLDALPTLPFQDGLPKGVKAVGWKVGTRIYLLEMHLRTTVMAKLDPDIRGALEGAYAGRDSLAKFTQELLKAFDSKGWLVKEHLKTKLEAKDALWIVQAGKYEFKGVIILDLPKDYLEVLPSKDSLYELSIKGPLFPPPANQSVTASELADLGLFKKPAASTAPAAGAATATSAPTPAPKATQPASTTGATSQPAVAPGKAAAPGTTPAPANAPSAPAANPLAKTANEFTDLGLFRKPAASTPANGGGDKPAPQKELPVKTAPPKSNPNV